MGFVLRKPMTAKTYDSIMIAKYEAFISELNTERERFCTSCQEKTSHLFVSELSESVDANESTIHDITFVWRCDECGEEVQVASFRFRPGAVNT
jgi:ribosomal protein L44E